MTHWVSDYDHQVRINTTFTTWIQLFANRGYAVLEMNSVGRPAMGKQSRLPHSCNGVERRSRGLPICMAKTQYSFSTDPNLLGAPKGHVVPIREIRLAAGAEFLVVVCGAIMTMPGLPRVPAADSIRVNQDGQIEGLF